MKSMTGYGRAGNNWTGKRSRSSCARSITAIWTARSRRRVSTAFWMKQ